MAGCANPVSPTGGPKDTFPPKVVKTIPANQSVNFDADKVTITFDEFVTLKDITTQLVVSPPLKEQPEFTTRGKSLIMKFKEPLKSNTTYNCFFANSIVDLTESNPLAGYQFTFSTGPVLDSLTIGGKLINAFNRQPVKDAFVMLYDTIFDSIPYKERPYYLARTDNNGNFNLNNLRDDRFLMFAITDINSDYIYNQPMEDISFADSLMRPHLPEQNPNANDSLPADSIPLKSFSLPDITMRHFRETDSIQKLIKASLARENVLSVVFKYPVKQPHFEALKPTLTGDWNITGYNKSRDTLTLWIPSPGVDSLKLVISDLGYTSDTVELSLKPRSNVISKSRSNEKAEVIPKLVLKHNLASARIRPDRSVVINFSEPVTWFDFGKISLFSDSLLVKPSINFEDSIKTLLSVSYPWKEETNYKLIIPDSTFTGVFAHSNDSTGIKFSTLTEAETCLLKINVFVPPTGIDYIIQLLGEKEKILGQQTIRSDGAIEFNYLNPGKYKVKVIYDQNRNGRWDTGNYLKKRQPEFVDYHPKEFELRANWSLEEDWVIPEKSN